MEGIKTHAVCGRIQIRFVSMRMIIAVTVIMGVAMILILILFLFSSVFAGANADSTVSDNTIGYAGCSMTTDAVQGYHAVGGKHFWQDSVRYGGGSIVRWTSENYTHVFWSRLKESMEKYPDTKTIWVQLCSMRFDALNDGYEVVVWYIREIRKRYPGVEI